MHNLEFLLLQSDALPALPEIYTRVSGLIESENASSQDIGDAIQADPSLTAGILKLINSAFYGLTSEVTSVPQAISLLGRRQLKQIMLSSVLSSVFPEIDSRNFSLYDFWAHSIKTAIIARHLAMQNASIIDHEAFFTAGLLHDIGRLVIATVAPDELAQAMQLARDEHRDVVEVEAEMFGLSHIDVGTHLMREWHMPSLLVQCLVKHHDEEHMGPFKLDTCIVYLANRLSQQAAVCEEEDMQALLNEIVNWQKTQCTLEQVHIACCLADEQWLDVMRSLGMASNSD